MRNQMTWRQQQNSRLFYRISLLFHLQSSDGLTKGTYNSYITGHCNQHLLKKVVKATKEEYTKITNNRFSPQGYSVIDVVVLTVDIITADEFRMMIQISNDKLTSKI